MAHQQMYQQLETLKATLAQSEGLDDDARQRMLALIDRLEDQLHSEDAADGGLKSQLESHMAEFEVSHPALSRTLNELMVILGNMGV